MMELDMNKRPMIVQEETFLMKLDLMPAVL